MNLEGEDPLEFVLVLELFDKFFRAGVTFTFSSIKGTAVECVPGDMHDAILGLGCSLFRNKGLRPKYIKKKPYIQTIQIYFPNKLLLKKKKKFICPHIFNTYHMRKHIIFKLQIHTLIEEKNYIYI